MKLETGLEIAVIGMAGRFPGARDLDEYWDNLKNGVEGISFFSGEELEQTGVELELLQDDDYVGARGILEETDYFDSSFFGYIPIEAELMDPQVRIFHECAWQALEDAGVVPSAFKGRIGLYAGASPHLGWEVLSYTSGRAGVLGVFASWQLYDKDFMCTRVSYNLNLTGPSVNVETACSTSLVAIHLACQGLLSGECRTALAGGVTVSIPGKRGYRFQEGSILSPDGHCRAFDAKAKGTVLSSGAGIVVLKLLENALNDRDFIYAVIKGSAINNDGKGKVGFTAPGIKGQAGVIKSALRMARVKPETIGYIETHGTGTNLGDPAEIEALTQAFGSDKKGFCRIGSVKSNLGHADNAAGAAGFIKTVLSLKHGLIPPSLHCGHPNPKIDFDNTPFIVNGELFQWNRNNGRPLRAGISSFGVGGTNAHVVLEEYSYHEGHEGHEGGSEYRLMVLSAKTGSALEKMTGNLVKYLKQNPHINLADAAYTLQVGREAFDYRRMFLWRGGQELAEALTNASSFHTTLENRPVVFMFSGQGSQYADMGLGLYKTQPIFREELDRCMEILSKVFVGVQGAVFSKSAPWPPEAKINQTEIAQPFLFAFEYALAKLLMHWGIKPYAMIGHSIGEYVAACLAGVFSLEDGLKIIGLRGRLMQGMPSGGMLSVSLPGDELTPLLDNEISLAAVNSPGLCVVSGGHEVIGAFSKKLTEKGIENRILHTSHAFHSPMMDPILKEFEENVAGFPLHKPRIPYISNLTGRWITVEDAAAPAYWAKHLRQTVQFSRGVKELLKIENAVLLEVGPGKALATFARQHLSSGQKEKHMVMETVRHPRQEQADDFFLLEKTGRLWLGGVKINWTGFYGVEKRRRVPLPSYPFESRHFPIAGELFPVDGKMPPARKESRLRRKKDISDWFYVPLWQESVLPMPSREAVEGSGQFNWLVFCDAGDFSSRLVARLEQGGGDVITVKTGTAFGKESDREFMVNPGQGDDYNRLFAELQELGKIPRRVLHLWCVGDRKDRDVGFYSLLNIAGAIGGLGIKGDILIGVVTDGMQKVMGVEKLYPEKALLLGAVKTIPREYSNLCCCSIDIDDRGEAYLSAEFAAGFPDPVVVYRGNHRWVPVVKAVPLDKPGAGVPLKEKGVYLVTGGLGGIGITLAQYLAESVRARLVLTGRSSFPTREEWREWLITHDGSDDISRKIRRLQEMESCGAEVMVCSADAADPQRMQEVITLARQRFGPISGVIHSAGVPDGAVIQRRTRQMSEEVFAAKVGGTLVLDSLLKDEPLDFFVLCSSLASFLAPAGQVAYNAANAFLDAFARYKSAKNNTLYVGINWDSWQEVGMAADAVFQKSPLAAGGKLNIKHPLFDYSIETNAREKVYVSHFRADTHWVLDEHRVLGKPTLPGTACVEMARAAFEDHTGSEAVEIRELYFLTPLRLEENRGKDVHTLLEKGEDENDRGFKFTIKSKEKDRWQVHAVGRLAPAEADPLLKRDIKEIAAKCNKEEIVVSEGMSGSKQTAGKLNFALGPRWQSVKRINLGAHRALVLLELAEAFGGDIGLYKLHPALLDAAVGYFALVQSNTGGEASLPFSYKKINFKKPLSRRLYCYQEYKDKKGQNAGEGEKIVSYDITIMDGDGLVLVEIEDYKRMAVSEGAMARLSSAAAAGRRQEESKGKGAHLIGHGLLPSEGIEVFDRILARGLPRVAVSTRDFTGLLGSIETKALKKDDVLKGPGPETPRGPMRPRPGMSKAYTAPTGEIEKKIAETWQNFLGIEQIGIHDDFFELGGDSLKIMSISSKIHKILEVEIPLGQFFNNPTIAGIAAYIEGAETVKYSAIKPVEKKDYYPLSSAQMRMFIAYEMDDNKTGYNMPHVLVVEGRLERRRLNEGVAKVIRGHETLRTSFELLDNIAVQRVHEGGALDFSVDWLEPGKGDEDDIKRIVKEFIRPFDLGRAPLFRAGVAGLAEDKHLFIYDVHHIVCDGLSLIVIMNDFARMYRGGEFPRLKVQYKDFAAWQGLLLRSEELKKQEQYWLSRFGGDVPVLNMPTDFPRPAVQSFEGDNLFFSFDNELSAKIKSLVFESGTTLYMVTLSIYVIFLSRYSGQEDIVVGAAAAGRPHADLENLVGMFVDTLAIRNFPGSKKSYREFLEEVKTNALAAFENQDYQFDHLVEQLGIPRHPGRNPLFDTMFVAQNIGLAAENLPREIEGLDFKDYLFEDQYTQFDIVFHFFEIDGILSFKLLYSTRLYKRGTIEKFVEYFEEIASIVVENPGIQLEDIKVSHRLLSSKTSIIKEDEGDFVF